MSLEAPPPGGSAAPFRDALNSRTILGGSVAFLFAVTGPLAIILSVTRSVGLPEDVTMGWIFGGYGVCGLASIVFSLLYKQPIGLAWTIPGAAILLSALDHLSFAEAVAAYLASGLLIAMLGVSGWIGWLTERTPVPVVMGMVAGVFLPIGLEVVTGFAVDPTLAGATVAGFVLCALIPRIARVVPPVLGALVAGAAAMTFSGQIPAVPAGTDWLVRPVVFAPDFTIRAMAELVLPLSISVLAVQNLQGFSVLRDAGHVPPANTLTTVCGFGSFVTGIVGSVPMCVAGPSNAIMVSMAAQPQRYAAGMVFGVLMLCFGLFAPITVVVASGLPITFIGVLGGLAMLPVLGSAFRSAFSGKLERGALIAFMVTVSGIELLNIGAPFWGLVFGYVTSRFLDRD